MNFIPRDKAPSKTNKFYYSDINTYYKNGYGMPNCTCYTYGRGLEITNGTADLPKNANAHSWWSITKGYTKDNKPSVGAIMCFSGGNSGKGHVCMVEYCYANGDVKTSNSIYKGTNFYMQTLHYPYNYGKLKFQGFIHLLKEPEPVPPTPEHVYYIVQKGDNLSKIAKKYNTTWRDIYNKNKTLIDTQAKKHGVKSNFFNHIYIGEKLLIK